MGAGDKEIRKAFEEVTTRNVNTCVNYSKATRKIVRELEGKMLHLEEIIREQDLVIDSMKKQISLLQQKIYKGGTT